MRLKYRPFIADVKTSTVWKSMGHECLRKFASWPLNFSDSYHSLFHLKSLLQTRVTRFIITMYRSSQHAIPRWRPSRGGHFHIMELRIRVNKNVEKGSDFCHRASSTFLEIRGQFSTTSTLRVSILNNEHRHLGSYFRPIRCCMLLQITRFSRNWRSPSWNGVLTAPIHSNDKASYPSL